MVAYGCLAKMLASGVTIYANHHCPGKKRKELKGRTENSHVIKCTYFNINLRKIICLIHSKNHQELDMLKDSLLEKTLKKRKSTGRRVDCRLPKEVNRSSVCWLFGRIVSPWLITISSLRRFMLHSLYTNASDQQKVVVTGKPLTVMPKDKARRICSEVSKRKAKNKNDYL